MIDLMILYILLTHDLTMYSIQKRIQENFRAYTNPSFGALKTGTCQVRKKRLYYFIKNDV